MHACKKAALAQQLTALIVLSLSPLLSQLLEILLKPCHECTDFQVTVLQQLGLVLGLQNYTRPAQPPPLPPDTGISPPPMAPNAPPSPPNPPEYPSPSPPGINVTANYSMGAEFIFITNRTMGYNCSHPYDNVDKISYDPGQPQAPMSLMGQNRPNRYSIFNAWPRHVCPLDDDADGLRYLYPECEELLDCETLGGAEKPPEINATTFGCPRFVPADNAYSILDYYTPTAQRNWSNLTWDPMVGGRALPSTPCIAPYRTELGRTGFYRVILLFWHALLPWVLVLFIAKIICRLCLRMPWMTRTRKRNEKLQRTAAKRKAEVRRMTEGGQEFAVKRAARVTGQGDAATATIERIRDSATGEDTQAKKADAAGKLLNKMGKRPGSASGSAKVAPDPNSSAPAPEPLAITHKAPEAAPAAASSSSDGAALGTLRTNLGAPAGAPSFAEQMRQLTKEAEGKTE